MKKKLNYLFLFYALGNTLSAQSQCKTSFDFNNADNARVNIYANSAGALHQLYDISGFTWEAWFKLNTSIINYSSIISIEDSILCQDIFLGFGWGSTPNSLSFAVRENGPGCITAIAESLQNIIPNTWYHIAAVCDYNNAILKLYLNGNLSAAGIIPAEVLTNKLFADHLTQIGNQSAYAPNGIDGEIDEVRFWNKVRTQIEIQSTMNQCITLPQAGLIAYFKANENMGVIAASEVNTNFIGVLENATWSIQGPPGMCSSISISDSLTGCNNYFFSGSVGGSINNNNIESWQWDFGDGGTSNTQNTSHTYAAGGTYMVTLIVTDSNECKDSTMKNVIGSFQITPHADTTVCAGHSVTLSVNLGQSLNDTILSPGSQFEYNFSTPPTGWITILGGWPSGNAPFGNLTNGFPPEFNYTTYWPAGIPEGTDGFDLRLRRVINLTGYDLSTIKWYLGVDNGFVLYVNGTAVYSDYADGYTNRWEYSGMIPAALLNPGTNIIAIGLSDDGESTAFDMMITGQRVNIGTSILWSTGDTTTTITVAPIQTTTYYVTVMNGSINCTDSVRVTVNKPSMQLINASICQGEYFNGYSVSGTYIDTLVAFNRCDSIRTINLIIKPKSYSVMNQSICQGQNYLGYSTSGTYIDTLVAANGCDSIRTLQLTVIPKPVPDLGIDKNLCFGHSLILYPGQFTSYLWQDGTTKNNFTIKQEGLYSVIVTNNCGTARDEISVKEIICDVYFPSAFTPNNDGKNDLFKVLGAYNLSDYHLAVYNRWGQKVFETNDCTKGWDGSFNGQSQSSTIFVWYCEFNKQGNTVKTKMKGTVVLIK